MTPAAASSAADAIDAALLEGQGLLQLCLVQSENIHRLGEEHDYVRRAIETVADTLGDATVDQDGLRSRFGLS
jgi:hypothetical protein